jgi:CheY-like chemotaxis protein
MADSSDNGREPYLVLVADDDDDAREAIADTLEEAGFRVAEASDGVEALQQARTLRPRVLVLDQRMPKLFGSEVVSRLRAEGLRFPVVLMSGSTDLLRASGETHVDYFLTKPFEPEQLVSALLSALAATELGRAEAVAGSHSAGVEKRIER